MIIKLKNKDTLICDDFQFRCSIGKNGLKKNKLEGDNCTPSGTFSLGPVYFRNDRIDKIDEILFSMIKLLVLLTIIGITPFYVILGIMTRQMTEKSN